MRQGDGHATTKTLSAPTTGDLRAGSVADCSDLVLAWPVMRGRIGGASGRVDGIALMVLLSAVSNNNLRRVNSTIFEKFTFSFAETKSSY